MNDFKKMVDLERRKAWVWANAREITGRDRRVWRRDSLGAVIRYCDYGNRSSPYGWTIEQNLAVRAELPHPRPLPLAAPRVAAAGPLCRREQYIVGNTEGGGL